MSSVLAGQELPLEFGWLVGTTPQAGTGALELRRWSAGVRQWWTGAAWTTVGTSLPLTYDAGDGVHRYVLTVPAAWAGLVIEAVGSLPGQVPQSDELVIAALPSPVTSQRVEVGP